MLKFNLKEILNTVIMESKKIERDVEETEEVNESTEEVNENTKEGKIDLQLDIMLKAIKKYKHDSNEAAFKKSHDAILKNLTNILGDSKDALVMVTQFMDDHKVAGIYESENDMESVVEAFASRARAAEHDWVMNAGNGGTGNKLEAPAPKKAEFTILHKKPTDRDWTVTDYHDIHSAAKAYGYHSKQQHKVTMFDKTGKMVSSQGLK